MGYRRQGFWRDRRPDGVLAISAVLCRGGARGGQDEAVIAEFERATQLNPNLTDHHFAWALLVTGEPVRAAANLAGGQRNLIAADRRHTVDIEAQHEATVVAR